MKIHIDDDGFVRAPAGLVYRRLTDVGSWAEFWPGLVVAGTTGVGEDQLFSLVLRPMVLHRLRLQVHPHAWRHDEGFRLTVAGDLTGEAEFWLESGWGGTVVHHLAALEASGRGHRLARGYRAGLRLGLGGLKDDAQSQVRERLGMVP